VNERAYRWTLIGLILLAFVLRVVGLDFQSLWRDEVDAIRFASRDLPKLFERLLVPGENGPLFYILLRPWLDLAGRSEFALRFFSVAFGVLLVPLVYRLGRRLFSSLPLVGLLAAFLATVSPYLVWYSQEGKMYALVAFLVALSMERYLAALERGKGHRWLVYVLVTSVAFYTHLIAAFIIPTQAVIFFLQTGETRRARWKLWLASLAALTLPYLPLLVWQAPLLLNPSGSGYAFLPLHEMFFSLLSSYSLGVTASAGWWTLALFVGLLLAAGLLLAGNRARRISVGLLFCWLLAPILGFFLITLARPLFTARYLIFVLPAYFLLLAAGAMALARRSRLLAVLLLAGILMVNGWGLWHQATTAIKADFRAATAYVTEHWSPRDFLVFQIPYGKHSFDYYYQPEPSSRLVGGNGYRTFLPLVVGGGEAYRWADGLYTNAGLEPDAVDQQMAALTSGSRVVWLIATEVPLWDERGLVQAWLEDNAQLTASAEFVRVAVYRYEFP